MDTDKRKCIKAGRIEFRQDRPDGPVKLTHYGKITTMEIEIEPRQLEAWAVRQFREKAFA